MTDFRPADANETAAAWRLALERKGPSFFALSRQDLPVIDPASVDVYAGVSKGAYILARCGEAASGADRHGQRSLALH